MRLTLGQLRSIVERVLYEKKNDVDTGQFKTGDKILFGKYKNKRGTIKRTFKDDKDHASIEIEPNPKGRKKNVEMGLYKVWPDDEKDDATQGPE